MEFHIDYQGSIDDISEITISYKKPISPFYAIVRYCCQRNKPYKILQYSIIGKDVLNGKDKRLWEWYPSMNFGVVEDGFTNEYDAKVRLKELQKKEQENVCK